MPTLAALAPEDAARLHMDLPENRMIIVAALALGARLGEPSLLRILRERLTAERFRQRVRESRTGLRSPRWEVDPAFDVARHVRVHAASDRSLDAIVSEIANADLPRDRPLWEVHLVERANADVIVVRVHHVVADGAGLVRLLEGIADERGASPPRAHAPRAAPAHGPRARLARIARGARAAVNLLLSRSDPPLVLTGRLGSEKRLCASNVLSLDEVHRAAHAQGATIAEALLACVACAIRERAGAQRGPIHALVPVALRGDGGGANNHYVSVFVPLHATIGDADVRVRAIASELREQRGARATIGAGSSLTSAAGAATAAIERLGVRLFSRRASVMVSVVRGSEKRLHVAGVPIDDITVWAPMPGTIALGVTFMSYAGRARVAVVADAAVAPDPDGIARTIERELAALASA